MDNKEDQVKNKKGFFARMIEKLDKKMREKAAQSCCCGKDKTNKGSCCN
ncbi:MAG: hypothetical protein PHW98_03735 [Candidatus Omnitrophica bacterium]|nr:hypothetical protein [Candidatus Omnitrophota bacterium]MDD5771169.1 hypothetical protein [Candidatus Omnitrophota bacterium]